ncbi:hypothetical protein DPEC_G00038280 [Dallia pectoralis]|uniref:Uncharacterized protein n=1 Tax=Dallia pectoralis TaxID=75939 RepID=A0ACC2HET3_DALPE|nr:hypothetical protein DPEC_G00038280 [Dallia pectoralis]
MWQIGTHHTLATQLFGSSGLEGKQVVPKQAESETRKQIPVPILPPRRRPPGYCDTAAALLVTLRNTSACPDSLSPIEAELLQPLLRLLPEYRTENNATTDRHITPLFSFGARVFLTEMDGFAGSLVKSMVYTDFTAIFKCHKLGGHSVVTNQPSSVRARPEPTREEVVLAKGAR